MNLLKMQPQLFQNYPRRENFESNFKPEPASLLSLHAHQVFCVASATPLRNMARVSPATICPQRHRRCGQAVPSSIAGDDQKPTPIIVLPPPESPPAVTRGYEGRIVWPRPVLTSFLSIIGKIFARCVTSPMA